MSDPQQPQAANPEEVARRLEELISDEEFQVRYKAGGLDQAELQLIAQLMEGAGREANRDYAIVADGEGRPLLVLGDDVRKLNQAVNTTGKIRREDLPMFFACEAAEGLDEIDVAPEGATRPQQQRAPGEKDAVKGIQFLVACMSAPVPPGQPGGVAAIGTDAFVEVRPEPQRSAPRATAGMVKREKPGTPSKSSVKKRRGKAKRPGRGKNRKKKR